MSNHNKRSSRYAQTVNLPKTTFPMRANLPRQEPEMLRWWQTLDLYRCAQERTAGHERFILHDGPPFSNGSIHLGHTLNKVLKDIVVKFRSMQGYDAPFVPGWDTHGLPTEILAIRDLARSHRSIPTQELRRRCAEIARKYVEEQREQFERLGVRGDWHRPYLTMRKSYEAGVLQVFRQLVEQGLIYRGVKPVHWCTACETALAEAEIEYHEREGDSIYVAFPVLRMPETLFPGEARERMSAVIWTTTPWTLPASVAVAVHPDTRYALVTDAQDEEHFSYLVAREVVERFAKVLKMRRPKVLGEVSGRKLEGVTLLHPFLQRESPVVLAEFITLDSGTGLVYLAPGHGQQDFEIGVEYGLPVIQPIGPSGIYGAEAGPFAGKSIFQSEPELLERLDNDGTLLARQAIRQQYPHCWRCRGPVIERATKQWFFAVSQLSERAMAAMDGVQWLPAWGKERLASLVQHRPDWCISRQRVWGIPIPAFYCRNCGEPLLSPELIARVETIVREEGSEAWLQRPVGDFLPEGTACPACGVSDFTKETDIFDVWFDSGCSHTAVLAQRADLSVPADLYLEGQDQYRGWFQASLLTYLGMAEAEAPYRRVLSHGFVLDQSGRKHAKSPCNLIDPQEVVKKYGADILRLWVASADTRADIAMSEEAFTRVVDVYRRLRNTARFLLGNLYDFTPDRCCPLEELQEIDRWALHRLNTLVRRVTDALEQYEFHRVYQALNEFCAVEMSAFYLDVLKDRLYILSPDDPARRAAQTTLFHLVTTLAQLLAPLLSFSAEEIWQQLPGEPRAESVQLTEWPVVQAAWTDEALGAKWTQLLAVCDEVSVALAAARTKGLIAQPLAAKVTIYAAGDMCEVLDSLGEQLPVILRVSAAELRPRDEAPAQCVHTAWPQVAINVTHAAGEQCERCRLWRPLGAHRTHPTLCDRCAYIVESRQVSNNHAA